MPARGSRVLQRVAKTDHRVSEYEFDPGNEFGQHWLHMSDGWEGPNGSVHERTVADCLEELRSLRWIKASEERRLTK